MERSIRTSALEGGRSIVVVSDPRLAALSWLPGGRLIYALFDAPTRSNAGDGNLWDVSVDSRTGEPSGKPVQLTRWAGFRIDNFSSSADEQEPLDGREFLKRKQKLVVRAQKNMQVKTSTDAAQSAACGRAPQQTLRGVLDQFGLLHWVLTVRCVGSQALRPKTHRLQSRRIF